jgi:hypothetical protein
MRQHFVCAEQSTGSFSRMGKWKSSWCYWFTIYRSYIFWRTYGDWWHSSVYVGVSFSYLSGQGVACSLDKKRRGPFPGPLVHQTSLLWIFSSLGWKIHYHEKCKIWLSCVTELSNLQSALPLKYFPVPVKKLNIVLMCVVSLTVPILRSAGHTRKFVRFSIRKCIGFSITFYGWRYMFYFIDV